MKIRKELFELVTHKLISLYELPPIKIKEDSSFNHYNPFDYKEDNQELMAGTMDECLKYCSEGRLKINEEVRIVPLTREEIINHPENQYLVEEYNI